MKPIGAISYSDGTLGVFFQEGDYIRLEKTHDPQALAKFEARYPTLPVTTSKPYAIKPPVKRPGEWWRTMWSHIRF